MTGAQQMLSCKLTRSIAAGVAVIAIGGGTYWIVAATANSASATASASRAQIPPEYKRRTCTMASGPASNNAMQAALAAYPGGIVDRVVQLSNGEYEVHYIGVNLPHPIFVTQDFTAVVAD